MKRTVESLPRVGATENGKSHSHGKLNKSSRFGATVNGKLYWLVVVGNVCVAKIALFG